jgi:hypothetical protein
MTLPPFFSRFIKLRYVFLKESCPKCENIMQQKDQKIPSAGETSLVKDGENETLI